MTVAMANCDPFLPSIHLRGLPFLSSNILEPQEMKQYPLSAHFCTPRPPSTQTYGWKAAAFFKGKCPDDHDEPPPQLPIPCIALSHFPCATSTKCNSCIPVPKMIQNFSGIDGNKPLMMLMTTLINHWCPQPTTNHGHPNPHPTHPDYTAPNTQ